MSAKVMVSFPEEFLAEVDRIADVGTALQRPDGAGGRVGPDARHHIQSNVTIS